MQTRHGCRKVKLGFKTKFELELHTDTGHFILYPNSKSITSINQAFGRKDLNHANKQMLS